jgi:hypothetical protein
MFLVRNDAFKRDSLILFLLFWLGAGFSLGAAQSVTLGWDPSSDPNAAGYNIYYGTESRKYTEKVSAGNGTTVTIGGLIEGTTYFFAATTYDIFNQESGFSEEVPYEVPGSPMMPTVTNCIVAGQQITLGASAIGTGELTYQWQFNSTDIPSATNASLTLSDIATNQTGIYSVTVSDDAGLSTNLAVYVAVYATAAATLAQPAFVKGFYIVNVAGVLGLEYALVQDSYSFTVSGVPGYEYVVEASTNLTDWVAVRTNIAPFDFADPDTPQFAQRFYRSLAPSNQPVTNDPAESLVPGVPAPPANLLQAAHEGGTCSFLVAGEPGCEYIVQASSDLVNWVPVRTNLAPFIFADVAIPPFDRRFYRALSTSAINAILTFHVIAPGCPAPARPPKPVMNISKFWLQLTK